LVSIVIPCRNERGHIEKCVRSVLRQESLPDGFELIVADGMSDDGTREILTRLAAEDPRLQVIDNPQRIVPTALNLAIRRARGEWVVRLDAHSEYPPNYLKLCIETGERRGADNVGGAVVTLSREETFIGRIVQALTTHRFGVGNAGFRVGAEEGVADTVPFGCYRRQVFERVGWFDERLVRNQDYEFNRRLAKAGGKVWFTPRISAVYYNQGDLAGLLRQAFVTGEWNVYMWYVAPYSFVWRHAIPLAFVTSLIFTGLCFLIWPWFAFIVLAAIAAPYLTLALAAAREQSKRYGKRLFLLLPVAFWLYHLAYGIGGVKGILRLLVRRSPVQSVPEPWKGAGSFRAWTAISQRKKNKNIHHRCAESAE
jgi:glycosyltransferase involved in cell wall biosynthesis